MARTDFIADFLTVIRNAGQARKEKVTIPASKITTRIAEILKEEGFVENVKPFTEGKKQYVRVHLKYIRGKHSAIQGMTRISSPGLRTYVGADEVPRVRGGLGIAILSTSKGLMTDQTARKERAGGELLCKVW